MKRILFIAVAVFAWSAQLLAQQTGEIEVVRLEKYLSQCKEQLLLLQKQMDSITAQKALLPEWIERNPKEAFQIKDIYKEAESVTKKTKSLNGLIEKFLKSFRLAETAVSAPIEGPVYDPDVSQDPRAREQEPEPQNAIDLPFSFSELSEEGMGALRAKKDSVLQILEESANLYRFYESIFDLFLIQFEVYNKKALVELVKETSEILKGNLLDDRHYDELQQEIKHVRQYRFAFVDLLQLIKTIEDPSPEIVEAIKNAGAGETRSKIKGNDIDGVTDDDIIKYLGKNKNATEYIDMFEYTREIWKEYKSADSTRRKEIAQEIENALK